MHMGSGLFPCDPHGSACVRGDPAIRSHGIFQGNIGNVPGDVMEKDRIDAVALLPQEILDDFDARGPELTDAFSSHPGIWIRGSDDDPFDPAGDHSLGTGRLLSVMAAGLQCNVHIRSLRGLRQISQRFAFGMQTAIALMTAQTYDPVLFDDHRANHWIGAGMARGCFCQVDGMPHIFFIWLEGLFHPPPFQFLNTCFPSGSFQNRSAQAVSNLYIHKNKPRITSEPAVCGLALCAGQLRFYFRIFPAETTIARNRQLPECCRRQKCV